MTARPTFIDAELDAWERGEPGQTEQQAVEAMAPRFPPGSIDPSKKKRKESTSMSNDPFDSPASSIGIRWEELNGRLLLITPLAFEAAIKTVHGAADAVRANVVVLDGTAALSEYRDTLIFPKILMSQVRANIGTSRANLGRLGQGEKKPGQTAPWKLSDPTDTDKDVARSYYAGSLQRSESEPVAAASGGAKRPW